MSSIKTEISLELTKEASNIYRRAGKSTLQAKMWERFQFVEENLGEECVKIQGQRDTIPFRQDSIKVMVDDIVNVIVIITW